MKLSKINRHGQVSIPLKIRKNLGIQPGDLVSVELQGVTGRITVTPVSVKAKSPWGDLSEYEDRGVDLTLLWENLKKTPTERVLRNEDMSGLVDEARKGLKAYAAKSGTAKRSASAKG